MLLFAHLGLTLAAGRLVRRAGPSFEPSMAFLALGSMLPDIIDKPLGWAIYGTPGMGRIYAHTLLFLLVLISISILARSRETASLSGGVASHLILDSMWLRPATLFWPHWGAFPWRWT